MSVTVDETRVRYDTHAVVCPYCGMKDRDAWDIFDRNHQSNWEPHECGHCERTFAVRRVEVVTYESAPLRT